jgi:pimeloyl-ACP methyl ester carboxylesterase
MSSRTELEVEVLGGTLRGYVSGVGAPVVLLHGGPGLAYEYMDPLVDELAPEFTVATFQQRGLEPSTPAGPFTIVQAIQDVVAVLDTITWTRALVVGHSWGGHLALRFAAVHPERVLGVLAVDPNGIAGDGGRPAFEAEIASRLPKSLQEWVRAYDERWEAGTATLAEAIELHRIIWPGYFADPENVPSPLPERMSLDAMEGIFSEIDEGIEEVAAALSRGDITYGIVAGGASPMPWGQAARATAELSPSSFLRIVPQAGHFVWYEAPGAVMAALKELQASI